MRRVTKAALAAIAFTGAAAALAAPANAQASFGFSVGDPNTGAYAQFYGGGPYGPPVYAPPAYVPPPPAYGPDAYGYDPYAGQYAYDPAAACDYYDYYNPPWGYPPDYCNYQVWQEPIYVGGAWYEGPIYYRTFGA